MVSSRPTTPLPFCEDLMAKLYRESMQRCPPPPERGASSRLSGAGSTTPPTSRPQSRGPKVMIKKRVPPRPPQKQCAAFETPSSSRPTSPIPSVRLTAPVEQSIDEHRDERAESVEPPHLSTSPSRCPHCTIHSWLPHSHSCPNWKKGGLKKK